MKLINKLKIAGTVAVATGLTALMLNENPESWNVSAKIHELSRTYAEQTIYPVGDFFVVDYTGRTMIDDEDFKIKLSKKTYAMAHHPIVMYSEREVKVNRDVYESIKVGESGVNTFRSEIQDTDIPIK